MLFRSAEIGDEYMPTDKIVLGDLFVCCFLEPFLLLVRIDVEDGIGQEIVIQYCIEGCPGSLWNMEEEKRVRHIFLKANQRESGYRGERT